MKKIFLVFCLVLLLGGCQTLGDHYSCLAEVDRTVPAQTQQRYIRTDTKCVKSNEQTVTGAFGSTWGTVYNPGQGDVNCSSVPIYETVILNQVQRDAAYQQCRSNVGNQRSQQGRVAQQQQSYTSPQQQTYSPPVLKNKMPAGSPYCRGMDINGSEYKALCEQPTVKSTVNPSSVKNVETACTSATVKGSTAYNKCVDELSKTSKGSSTNSAPQPLQPFTDAEWKAKVDKNKQIQVETLRKKRAAEDFCLGMGLTINTQDFSRCVFKETTK
jgi:hypothetical protein